VDYNLIRDKIEAVFPICCSISTIEFASPGGFHLAIPPRDRVWRPEPGVRTFWSFRGRRRPAQLGPGDASVGDAAQPHDQYNTTIYSLDDRYRGVFGGRMVVFMNAADMRARASRKAHWSRSSRLHRMEYGAS